MLKSTKQVNDCAKLVFINRARAGMTQSVLARKCGMKQEAIARIESGAYEPSVRTLRRIAAALKMTLSISLLKSK